MTKREILKAVEDLHARECSGMSGPGISMGSDGIAYAMRRAPKDPARPGLGIWVELWRHDLTLAWTGPATHVMGLKSKALA